MHGRVLSYTQNRLSLIFILWSLVPTFHSYFHSSFISNHSNPFSYYYIFLPLCSRALSVVLVYQLRVSLSYTFILILFISKTIFCLMGLEAT